MAFFKEPLHNANDITVSDVKYTETDVNLHVHRFDLNNEQDFPMQLRYDSSTSPSEFGLIVFDDAIHILGAYTNSTGSQDTKSHTYHYSWKNSKGVSGYRFLEYIPFPFFDSSAAVLEKKLYLFGLSGYRSAVVDEIYRTIYLYNEEKNMYSVFHVSDYSLKYAKTVVAPNPSNDSQILIPGEPMIWIFGGEGNPHNVLAVNSRNQWLSGYSLPSDYEGGQFIDRGIDNSYSHVVYVNDEFHAFIYDTSTNITDHYITKHGMPWNWRKVGSFNTDKITNVIIAYDKIYIFTYHSGIYIWDSINEQINQIQDTSSYYFLPNSVIFYNNAFHVFGYLKDLIYSEKTKHRRLDCLYTLDLGDTQ